MCPAGIAKRRILTGHFLYAPFPTHRSKQCRNGILSRLFLSVQLIPGMNLVRYFLVNKLHLSSNHMVASRGTVPSLDGLRAISILLVLLAHFVNTTVFPGGLGVYVFFVISGFLITRLLVIEHHTTGGISLRLFYTRRILRLYPVIITFSVWVIGMDLALGRPYNLLEPLSALGYFANYYYVYLETHGIQEQMPFGVFWSLSIEEHFYILFPISFVLLKGRATHLMWLLIALCTLSLGSRLGMAWFHPEYLNTQMFYAASQYRLDSIGFGVILALACQMDRGRRFLRGLTHPAVAVSALAVVLACLVVRDPWFRETLRYTLLGCAIDVLVAAVLFGPRLRFIQQVLNTAILAWIGRLSYSLYVWHEGVASFLPLADMPHWRAAGISMIATAAVAVISYYGVEQPFLSLRRHFRSRWVQPAIVGQPAH
jgi:peptidoglycan/LPS O-acetylase OafA/YrhL